MCGYEKWKLVAELKVGAREVENSWFPLDVLLFLWQNNVVVRSEKRQLRRQRYEMKNMLNRRHKYRAFSSSKKL